VIHGRKDVICKIEFNEMFFRIFIQRKTYTSVNAWILSFATSDAKFEN
jgi:hypothetical protein